MLFFSFIFWIHIWSIMYKHGGSKNKFKITQILSIKGNHYCVLVCPCALFWTWMNTSKYCVFLSTDFYLIFCFITDCYHFLMKNKWLKRFLTLFFGGIFGAWSQLCKVKGLPTTHSLATATSYLYNYGYICSVFCYMNVPQVIFYTWTSRLSAVLSWTSLCVSL